ncbi:hypothetical protein L2755_19215 [Shewanella abyssi]|uniref:hypothetical protein n=1 Tax=Shewanella abyssi TaxID=311789 RepID=UPI00201040B8|nr:hypothetical protein [Shewanella abyssi]MCL1051739.1 hypothetical protein [Shewanella abyssi]
MHLLLVSIALPIIAALLLPCILGADPKALPISWHIDSKSFKERLKMYFIGGYKIVFNRAALIAIFEIIGYFFKDTLYAIFKSLEYFLVSWFQLIGFFEQTSIFLAEFWLLKTVSSRDLSMIKLAESDCFLTMTAGEQLSAIFIILNIACLSALCSITLNLMALLGRNSSSTIKLIPAAFITSILMSHGIAMIILLFY